MQFGRDSWKDHKTTRGRITVTLPDENTLVVKDNGTGIAAVSAMATLTAIGLSKKTRTKDAGFRGIGGLRASPSAILFLFAQKRRARASKLLSPSIADR